MEERRTHGPRKPTQVDQVLNNMRRRHLAQRTEVPYFVRGSFLLRSTLAACAARSADRLISYILQRRFGAIEV